MSGRCPLCGVWDGRLGGFCEGCADIAEELADPDNYDAGFLEADTCAKSEGTPYLDVPDSHPWTARSAVELTVPRGDDTEEVEFRWLPIGLWKGAPKVLQASDTVRANEWDGSDVASALVTAAVNAAKEHLAAFERLSNESE